MKKSLSEQYELSLATLKLSMPVIGGLLILAGVILASALKEVFWVGIIVAVTGVCVLLLFLIIRNYLLTKIAELKKQESENPENDRK